MDCGCFLFCSHATKTRLGKCVGEGGNGSEGIGDGDMPEYIAWDKTLVDAEYIEELVKTKEGLNREQQGFEIQFGQLSEYP